jgi:hypothetical protein
VPPDTWKWPPGRHSGLCLPRRPRAQGPAAAATQTAGTSGSGTLPAPILALVYFTKYQFSGVMPSVGLCGRTPLRLLAISVSEYTPFGWNWTGNCCAR